MCPHIRCTTAGVNGVSDIVRAESQEQDASHCCTVQGRLADATNITSLLLQCSRRQRWKRIRLCKNDDLFLMANVAFYVALMDRIRQ